MRKILSVITLCALSLTAAQAAHVTGSQALEIAAKHIAAVPGGAAASVTGVQALNSNLYLVDVSPKGYVIVSADDNAEPIIAYSLESSINPASMPENMAFMLDEAALTVGYKSKNGTYNTAWKDLQEGNVRRSRAAGEPVDPLIQVKWNQGSPFNKYCPGEGKNKAVVGCVAVSMSQAMSVQRYPARPMGNAVYASPNYGQLSIDFEKEAAYDWTAIMSGANNYDDVAHLLHHAGMSVFMDYGPDGSGVPMNQLYRITNALKNNFGYPNTAYYVRDNYSGDWSQLLINELSAGRAIVYNALDSKGGYGHSFNLDGFDGDRLFHINWGWGGTGNGWFNVSAMKDEQMGMNYDSNHIIVVGIGAQNSPLRSISLSDMIVETDVPAGTPVFAVLVNDELPASGMTVKIQGEYNKTDGTRKNIPFEFKNGLVYVKEDLASWVGSVYISIEASMKHEGATVKLSQGFYVEVTAPQPIERRMQLSYDRASKTFSLHAKFGATYTIKNSQGTVIAQGTFDTNPQIEFSRSMLTPGDNTVEVDYNGNNKVLKLSL